MFLKRSSVAIGASASNLLHKTRSMVLFQNLYLLVCIKFYICGYYNHISNLFLCHFSAMSRQIPMLIKEEQKLLVKHSEILHQIIVSQTRNYFRLFFLRYSKSFIPNLLSKHFQKEREMGVGLMGGGGAFLLSLMLS